MSGLVGRWLPGIDPVTGSLSLPLWAAGALAALFVVVCLVALNRDAANKTLRVVVKTIVVFFAALTAVGLLQTAGSSPSDRRTFDARLLDLTTRGLNSGSPLACLAGIPGEAVEAACEKGLFATADSVTAAVSYVDAQIALLSEGTNAFGSDNADDSALAALRRALERDQYGFVAHALAIRDGCASEKCPTFALLHDPSHVRTNLKQQRYETLIRRYAVAWAPGTSTSVASASPPNPARDLVGFGNTAAVATPTPPPGLARVDFPSAASIPPVSIMNAEPGNAAPDQASADPSDASTKAETKDATATDDEKPSEPAKRPAKKLPSKHVASSNAARTPAVAPAAPAQAPVQAQPQSAAVPFAPMQLTPPLPQQ